MIKISAYYFLLSALSIVEMKPLNIKGRVGQNVTFTCSDWDSWTDVKYNDKYFCKSPCSEDRHIIIKAEFKDTKRENQMELTNSPEGLFVTFINLQKSDSGKYYCGVDRYGWTDVFIGVNLRVIDAKPPRPKTTPKTFPVTNSFTASSTSSDIISDTPFNIHPIATGTLGAGSAPYLIAGFIFIITLVVVLLMLTRRRMKKQPRVVSTTQEDTGENPADPDGVYQSLHSFTKEDQVYCNLNPIKRSAGPDGVYQSFHQPTKDEDPVYSTPTRRNAVPEKLPVDTSSGS